MRKTGSGPRVLTALPSGALPSGALPSSALPSAHPNPRPVVGLEAIYREQFAFVWRALRRLGVREADVADAAQEVFIVVHRKLGTFDFAVPITTWLYAICLRVASGRRRSAGTRHEVLCEMNDDASHFEVASGGAEADTTLERHRRQSVLEAALDAMPIEQRSVFTLFELDEWSGDRIADLLQIPLSTVHSRLRLARATFRAVVARCQKQEEFLLRRWGLSHE